MSSVVQLLSNFSVVTACGVLPKSSHWYEGWGAAVIGALVGGICAWIIVVVLTNDFSACKQTCLSLYELKKLLRRLAFYAEHRNQGDDGYYPILVECEEVVERLAIESSALCSRPPGMEILITKSLGLLKEWEPSQTSGLKRSSYIASELMRTWDPSKTNRPCFDTIVDFQIFLKRFVVYRLLFGRIRSE